MLVSHEVDVGPTLSVNSDETTEPECSGCAGALDALVDTVSCWAGVGEMGCDDLWREHLDAIVLTLT